jgi:hypothetical protein
MLASAAARRPRALPDEGEGYGGQVQPCGAEVG